MVCNAQDDASAYDKEGQDQESKVEFEIFPHPDSFKKFIDEPEKLKNCANSAINRHINMKFNISLFNHLQPGPYRVAVKFDIDENGEIVNILARGSHREMELEAIRVMKLLPKMNPALVNNEPKKVNFGLPINFVIQKNKKNRKNRKKKKKN
jgi:protein TonB